MRSSSHYRVLTNQGEAEHADSLAAWPLTSAGCRFQAEQSASPTKEKRRKKTLYIHMTNFFSEKI